MNSDITDMALADKSEHGPLAGKVAVVIGGAGGVGAATAAAFAAAGARVALTHRGDGTAARAIAAVLPTPDPSGPGHVALAADILDSASLAALAAEVMRRFGRVDMLVNAAGFTKPVPHADLDALDDALIDRMFAVNWRGQFAAIRAFRPHLATHGDGLVVSVSSLSATTGIGSNIAYCAVKAGIDVMTKSLARALAPDIRVLAVSPGVVDTDFVPGRDAAFNARIAASIPLRRIASPAEVARAILACATHLTYATGSVITLDGGRGL